MFIFPELNDVLSVLYTFVIFKNVLTIFGQNFALHVSGVYKHLPTALESKVSDNHFPPPVDGKITVLV